MEGTRQMIPHDDFLSAFDTYQALHITGFVPQSESDHPNERIVCNADFIQPLFDSLNDKDKASWCIEGDNNSTIRSNNNELSMLPSQFLNVKNNMNMTTQRGYCSFLVQHSKVELEKLITSRLPMVHLPVASGENPNNCMTGKEVMKVKYGPCLWIFFGKNHPNNSSVCNNNDNDDNNNNKNELTSMLHGRPEHTDSVTHDGTWHYQLSGTKIWRIRPTTELLRRVEQYDNSQQLSLVSGTKRKRIQLSNDKNAGDNTVVEENTDSSTNIKSWMFPNNKGYIEVICKQGDILFLNTRLWFHSTLIPPQDVPSVSYARDVYLVPDPKADDDSNKKGIGYCNESEEEEKEEAEEEQQEEEQESTMKNVDGTYATEDIDAETILFTEHTMPNCELHRSKTNPNCQVVELEDDNHGGEGSSSYMAVVTLRKIKAGEFFTILESDEEEDDVSDDDDIGEWEEEQDVCKKC
jgi:U3 small nucleolar RNA-associated protein 6